MKPPPIKRCSIIGDGAMGTVCAMILAEKGVEVVLWSNFDEQAAALIRDRENKRFLPGYTLDERIRIASDVEEAFDRPDLIVSAVPCQHMRSVWKRLANIYPGGTPIVAVSKGIEAETCLVSTEILQDVLNDPPVAALSGPSIAPELAARQPCAIVAAANHSELARLIQLTFSNSFLRVYTNGDLIGVELAGATKNIIALAAGIIDGVRIGCNGKAALVTRGLVEITRLGVAMGAHADTFRGLTGIGDLITTCISPVSRNRTAGEKIGRGMSTDQVIASTPSVIEGIPTTGAVLKLAKRHSVEMPITEAVAKVLSGERTPLDAIAELMRRDLTSE